MTVYEKLMNCYEQIKERIPYKPEIALILGSGLGDYADQLKIDGEIPYSEIEGFPKSTVQGHKGRFVFAEVQGHKCVIMQGRVHYYEGYDISDVVMPLRLMKVMGADAVLLTNAAGGTNKDFGVGSLMLIEDHISQFIPSPLIGRNIDEFGTRFPDMSDVYNKAIREKIEAKAKELNIPLNKGVYCQFSGPNYETPSEVRMAKALGADAVGMSTACEAMVAKHAGMKVAGISCISNMAAGISDTPLNHKEVQEAADKVAPMFKELVTAIIPLICETEV